MKIIFTLFLAIFLVSCGKTVENKVENTKTWNIEKTSTWNTETKTEISKNSEEKKYILTIQEKTGEDIAWFDAWYLWNLKFFEKNEDGEWELEFNFGILLKEGKIESLIVGFIPKDDNFSKVIWFEDKMYDLSYNISEKIAIWTPLKDALEMNVSDISEHEILAIALKDFLKQVSEK